MVRGPRRSDRERRALMAAGKRIALTAPEGVALRLQHLATSIAQEKPGELVAPLDVARDALLIGVHALEQVRRTEGAPPGLPKLIREALTVEIPPALPEGEARPETPPQRGWRTWRDAYLKKYARPYMPGPQCGKAMNAIARAAVDACAATDHDDAADLERLFLHWWRNYLNDPGYSKGVGDPGFLASQSHALAYFSRGIQSYGSPWDKEVKAVMRPALASTHAPRQLTQRTPSQRPLLDINAGAAGVLQATKGKAS